jgi:hypothetical protein
MAGTITVGELLSDPTSSNKITIGTGTTLDLVSGAGSVTLPPEATDAASLTGSLPSGMGGKVLQVVNTVDTTQTAVSSTAWTDIGLSATLTPQTGSKVLISFNLQAHLSSGNYGFYTRVWRDPGSSMFANNNTDPDVSYYDNSGSTDMRTKSSWSYLDSSVGGNGSTSITYKVQARTVSARTVTFSADSTSCEMTLLEIGA